MAASESVRIGGHTVSLNRHGLTVADRPAHVSLFLPRLDDSPMTFDLESASICHFRTRHLSLRVEAFEDEEAPYGGVELSWNGPGSPLLAVNHDVPLEVVGLIRDLGARLPPTPARRRTNTDPRSRSRSRRSSSGNPRTGTSDPQAGGGRRRRTRRVKK
jgi:hypothetical protein